MTDSTVQEQLDDLSEVVHRLLARTTAFQAVLTCLLLLTPPLHTREDIEHLLHRRFKHVIGGDDIIRLEIDLLLQQLFPD